MSRRVATPETIKAYYDIIEETITGAEEEWIQRGGSQQLLDKIQTEWIRRMNIVLGQTEDCGGDPFARAKSTRDEINQNMGSSLLDQLLGQNQSDSDEFEEVSDASDTDNGKEEEEEEPDEFGSDLDDDETEQLMNPVVTVDNLICHYVKEPKKKKSGPMSLGVALCHFTIDGVPRVAKSATINIQ